MGSAAGGLAERQAFIHGMWASVAPAWGELADELEQRSSAVTGAMLLGAEVGPGDRVLELACGPGGAGLAAARRVAPAGAVLLSDVVPAMVEIARRRAELSGLTSVRAEVLDLEDVAQPDESFDVVLCREGMMFAVDPGRAAAEMARVLRPGGRVAVAVWSSKDDNPWLGILLDSIRQVTGMTVPPPGMPGPFALADQARLRGLFEQAGFVALESQLVPAPVQAPSFEAWWGRTLRVAGPVVAILNGSSESVRSQVRDAAEAATEVHRTDEGLVLPALARVLTGRRP